MDKKEHNYPKSKKAQMHEYDPLLDETEEEVEVDQLNEKQKDEAGKPTKMPKKVRDGAKESYRPLS